MLRTCFLKRRQYMTTLGARWEKPDYTGVIAEVPLGHVPHPKNPSPRIHALGCASQIEYSRLRSIFGQMPIRWKVSDFASSKLIVSGWKLNRQNHSLCLAYFGRTTPRYLERVRLGNLQIFWLNFE